MKKMTLKPIIMSALAAIVFGTITVGTTFALFTDKAETKINVKSGKIDLNLELNSGLNLYSAVYDGTGEVLDENNQKYSLVEQTGSFLNGGTATVEGNDILVSNITPGDKIAFKLNISDDSNVIYKYRLSVRASKLNDSDPDGDYVTLTKNLESSLKFYGDEAETSLLKEKEISGASKYQTSWYLSSENAIRNHVSGEIMMPLNTGNIAQDKGARFTFTLEAVQGNAHVEGEEETIIAGASIYEVVHGTGSAYTIKKTDILSGATTDTDYILTAASNATGLFGNGVTDGILGKGDTVIFDDSEDPDAYSPGGKWIVNDGVTIKAKEGAHPVCTVKDGPLMNLNGDATFIGIKFVLQAGTYAVTPNVLNYNSGTTPTRAQALQAFKNTMVFDNCEFVGLNSSVEEASNNSNVAYGIQAGGINTISVTNSTFRNIGGFRDRDKHGMAIASFERRAGQTNTLTLANNTYENVYSVVDFIRSGDGFETISQDEIDAWENSAASKTNVAYVAYDYNAH